MKKNLLLPLIFLLLICLVLPLAGCPKPMPYPICDCANGCNCNGDCTCIACQCPDCGAVPVCGCANGCNCNGDCTCIDCNCPDCGTVDPPDNPIKAGTYEASAPGRLGTPLYVTVTIDATGKIIGLELDLPNESSEVGRPNGEVLKARILEAGHADVDAITGATKTTTGILAAVKKALKEAGVE